MSVSTILDNGDLIIEGGRLIMCDIDRNIALNAGVPNSLFPAPAGAIAIGVGAPPTQDPQFASGSICIGTSSGFKTSTSDSVNATNSVFIGTEAGSTLNLNVAPNPYRFVAIGEKALTNVGATAAGQLEQCVAVGLQAGSQFCEQLGTSLNGGVFIGSRTGLQNVLGNAGKVGVVVLNGCAMAGAGVAHGVPAGLTTPTPNTLDVGFYCTLPQFNDVMPVAGTCPVYYIPPADPNTNPLGQLIAGPVAP